MTLLYGAPINMVTQFQVQYATSIYAYTMVSLELKIQTKKFARKNFQFLSWRRNQEDCDNDSVISDAGVADNAAFEYIMDNRASRIWSTP